jgi:hypothetical protein
MFPVAAPNPEVYPIWKLAQSLGADVSTEVTDRTSLERFVHADQSLLVAAVVMDSFYRVNGFQVSECVERGNTWVLHPDWLWFCRWSLSRYETVYCAVTLRLRSAYGFVVHGVSQMS